MVVPVKSAVKNPQTAALQIGRDLKRVSLGLNSALERIANLEDPNPTIPTTQEIWAQIRTDGAGGVSMTVNNGIQSVSIVGSNVLVTFETPFKDADSYVISCSENGRPIGAHYAPNSFLATANTSTIRGMFIPAGGLINLSTTIGFIMFRAIGELEI